MLTFHSFFNLCGRTRLGKFPGRESWISYSALNYWNVTDKIQVMSHKIQVMTDKIQVITDKIGENSLEKTKPS